MNREQKFVELVLEKTGFTMEYKPKVDRAVFGSAGRDGLYGGVGEKATAEEILAKYDQLGGYITKDGYKVKNGVFFNKNSDEKEPVKNPDVVLLVTVNGETVEHREGEEETLELKLAKKQVATKVAAKKGPGRPKKEEEVPEPIDETPKEVDA